MTGSRRSSSTPTTDGPVVAGETLVNTLPESAVAQRRDQRSEVAGADRTERPGLGLAFTGSTTHLPVAAGIVLLTVGRPAAAEQPSPPQRRLSGPDRARGVEATGAAARALPAGAVSTIEWRLAIGACAADARCTDRRVERRPARRIPGTAPSTQHPGPCTTDQVRGISRRS